VPTYDYRCLDCKHDFEVIKSISSIDDLECCPSCLATCDKRARIITKGKDFFGEKPDEAFFSQALGKWVKSKKDQARQAKDRGWVEVGNENVERLHKYHDDIRDRKTRDSWAEFTNPTPYRVRGV
jgi:putative FmdB family regulatory protein